MQQGQPPRQSGPSGSTVLNNQAEAIWTCDFIQFTDVLFRSLFALVIVELSSRRGVPLGVTRHPSDEGVAQPLRQPTPFGQSPKDRIHDHDDKYGIHFAKAAVDAHLEVLTTAFQAPRANAGCERFIGSVRRACLDGLLLGGEAPLRRVLRA